MSESGVKSPSNLELMAPNQPKKLLEICVSRLAFAISKPLNPFICMEERVQIPGDLIQMLLEYGRTHQILNDNFLKWVLESEYTENTQINLSGCSRLTDEAFTLLAFYPETFENLNTLNVGRCGMITDISLGIVLEQCVHLEVLILDQCKQITERSFRCLRSKDLEEMDEILDNFNLILNEKEKDPFSFHLKEENTETKKGSMRKMEERSGTPLVKLKHLDVSGCGRLDDSFLALLVENLREIEHLYVNSCNRFGENAFNSFLRNQSNLKCFSASDCLWLSSVTLKTLSRCCPLLSSLMLNGSYFVDDEGLIQVSKECKNLKELSVRECNQLTDHSISSLFQNSVPLVTLDLCWCGLTDISFDQMQKSELGGEKGTLKQLKLSWCNQISEDGMREGLKNMPNLVSLDVSWLKLTDSVMESVLDTCKELSSLDISSSSDLSTEMLIRCAQLSQLKVLNLSWCRRVDDAVLTKISEGCPELRVIDISLCNSITDVGFSSLSNCAYLKGILASKCRNLSDLGIMEVVKKCTDLLFLNLTEWKLTDEGLNCISSYCPYLICVVLGSCKAITDAGVELLVKRCNRVQSLAISCCKQLTNEAIISVSKHLYRLQSLSASELPLVDDFGLSSLKECTLLQNLSISWCNTITDESIIEVLTNCNLLETLDLSFIDNLTNKSVKEVTKNTKFVKQLKLVGCRGITNESIFDFANNSDSFLQEKITLDVSFCPGITSKAMDEIQLENKKITIIKARMGDFV
eukprot:TRINITY_DN6248_c0_g1_i1.p1 TRINITY_DN6248_c0_g1~~TRINITY_DN6248_c0_g1_i1.p1  ORF type:complete len:751 (+),score=167.64 TRINITY_DN6248_c0_g1_i1:1516-3768(+)